MAVLRALLAFQEALKDLNVVVRTDNEVARAYLNRQEDTHSAPPPPPNLVVAQICAREEMFVFDLKAVYIGGDTFLSGQSQTEHAVLCDVSLGSSSVPQSVPQVWGALAGSVCLSGECYSVSAPGSPDSFSLVSGSLAIDWVGLVQLGCSSQVAQEI
ncbi:hypothetical protein NDU88_004608 [Pleurodeles waltl]|uniref:RNase H type-1 domain-containing protein n=1 Tax=Pleurodeles waltl TaxID=8319 RepID=A0AAV7M7K6_PLEWA|nr:hypothetical protein NDU88_004608 [Pleurodeles waltl]